MSNILHYPDAMEAPELQVWNNAAFDNEDSDGRWSSCLEPDPAFVNRSSDSSFAGKENLSPGISVSVPVKAPATAPAKTLRSNAAVLNCPPRPQRLVDEYLEEEEKKIESEIEAVEEEIGRLSLKLEALRIERKSKIAERRRRIAAAKFADPTPGKQKKPVFEAPRSVDRRRGMSLGPAEILSGAGMRRMSKLELTPIQVAAQSRRKSCFWKLEEVDELRATKQRGKSQSLSPRSRKTAMKTQPAKQSAATTTAKKLTGAFGSAASTIQPKKLFAGEMSAKKQAVRAGRVVASRYNSSAAARASGEARKRSLPEEEEERAEKKRMSRGKKKWEIPAEVVIFHDSPAALPNIRTLRRLPEESPARDSGPAKRVADLVGRRSHFCPEEEGSVCQALCFGEAEQVSKGN